MSKPAFDISIVDAINEFNLTKDEIALLGRMTQNREIACSKIGYSVMYRRQTLQRIFRDDKA